MSAESVIPSNNLIFCRPLLLFPKVLEFQLQHQSFQWIFRLISFRIDWLDLLAVQQALKCLLQHHSSKASILQCSVFFIVQLSHPHMTTGKTITLTRWTFVSKVTSLLFNMLSRFVMEKEMETHSSILVWKISWTKEPGRLHLPPWGLKSQTWLSN